MPQVAITGVKTIDKVAPPLVDPIAPMPMTACLPMLAVLGSQKGDIWVAA